MDDVQEPNDAYRCRVDTERLECYDGDKESSDEYDLEQEVYVYLNIGDKVDSQDVANYEKLRATAIETTRPIIQVGNSAYQGEFKDSLETMVFFDKHDDNMMEVDGEEKVPLKYFTKTNKMLELKATILNPGLNANKDNSKPENK